MHQREVFESMPGLHCEVHCFHASASTPRNKSTGKSLRDVKALDSVVLTYSNVRALQSSI